MLRVLAGIACAFVVFTVHADAQAPPQTVFYQSGDLRIEAYLYLPAGDGPFPLVVACPGFEPGKA